MAMKRNQLEHILRAAGAIAQERDLVVVGSQAILGAFPESPDELIVSMEADIFPLEHPEKADLIDGCIGELSPFHELYGYYAHGVGPETAILPANWRKRLVSICNENTNGISGWCLHPSDLAVSKILAHRPKDLQFVRQMLERHMIRCDDLEKLLSELPEAQAAMISTWLVSL